MQNLRYKALEKFKTIYIKACLGFGAPDVLQTVKFLEKTKHITSFKQVTTKVSWGDCLNSYFISFIKDPWWN